MGNGDGARKRIDPEKRMLTPASSFNYKKKRIIEALSLKLEGEKNG